MGLLQLTTLSKMEPTPSPLPIILLRVKNDQNDNVSLLQKAMLSRRGQYVASEAGYVPIKK